ncbi:ceramide synthase 1-like [Centruroides vittatus]|uniref:ceramide synthase 1-like n=1 Tax=Centruroides vittatus TaxID=120091 RepID=UPI00351036D3
MANVEFFKTPYGMFRIFELLLSISGTVAISNSFYCGNVFRAEFYESACIAAVIFIVIFVILYFFKMIDYFSQYFNVGILMFFIDLIFTIFFAISGIYMIFSITKCAGVRIARIFSAILAMLTCACFFTSSSFDFRWFQGSQPF